MAAGLVLLNLFLFTLLVRRWLINRNQFISWIQATLLSVTLLGLWIVLVTELLSLFRFLYFAPLVISWGVLFLVLFAISYHQRNHLLDGFELPLLSGFQISLVIIIGFIVIITGMIGIISPPNNWDSMTYHLSRVMHWVQNQSVAHYATYEVRQLYQNPWAEFVITHLYLLTNSDRLFNLVQWVAMIGCILGVSFIARLLGASLTGQILAGLVTATIPMGLLQSVTTQNDYVLAFWLVCLVVFILLIRQNPTQLLHLWTIAICLGLAILTKGTAYIFAAPFLLWFGLDYFKRWGWRLWQPVLIISLVIMLINGMHYYRNYQLFGSILSPDLGDYNYVNQTFGLAPLISNVTRNLALHFSVPVPQVKYTVEQGVIRFHRLLGLDPNDSATTWSGYNFQIPSSIIDENASGNFIHLGLVITSLYFILWWRLKDKRLLIFNYTTIMVLSFLCFAFYLKWQPWHSRLHLPLFVLWAPLLGLMVSQIQSRLVTLLVGILLVSQAVPFLLYNPLHPVWSRQNIWNIPRTSQYFLNRPALGEPYQYAVQEVIRAECNQLGLIMSPDSWEYPFWALFKQLSTNSIQIQSLEIKNQSQTLSNKAFQPCAVICLKCQRADLDIYTQLLGEPKLGFGPNLLFVKKTK